MISDKLVEINRLMREVEAEAAEMSRQAGKFQVRRFFESLSKSFVNHDERSMNDEIETILMLSPPELSSISSTIVREIILGNGDVSKFVPAEILGDLKSKKLSL